MRPDQIHATERRRLMTELLTKRDMSISQIHAEIARTEPDVTRSEIKHGMLGIECHVLEWIRVTHMHGKSERRTTHAIYRIGKGKNAKRPKFVRTKYVLPKVEVVVVREPVIIRRDPLVEALFGRAA